MRWQEAITESKRKIAVRDCRYEGKKAHMVRYLDGSVAIITPRGTVEMCKDPSTYEGYEDWEPAE